MHDWVQERKRKKVKTRGVSGCWSQPPLRHLPISVRRHLFFNGYLRPRNKVLDPNEVQFELGSQFKVETLPVLYIQWKSGLIQFSSVHCSVMSNSLQPHEVSTPGFPVHYQLPELAQTHVHRVGDALQMSHPLSSPSSPAFNLSQHQGLFWWVSSSHQVAKELELQLQHQCFQCIFRVDFL